MFPARRKKAPIRILLVICRPRGGEDVPFRSVASRLIKGLDEAEREVYELEVLRPPTFEQLGRVLRQAKAEGRPYHVLHFDGHGAFLEVEPARGLRKLLGSLSSAILTGPRSGRHGYLLFESPEREENVDLVDGLSLGRLLWEAGVPVLVLNACRSAHAEPPREPSEEADPHSQVRAFGSLAQEVMDAGAASVVAMRYNVYVVTAARFVAEMYASLVRGHTLGEAVTLARKHLADDPWREVVAEPLPLQDWSVPVVWEAAPLRLFPETKESGSAIRIEAGMAIRVAEDLASELPSPDAGFFGRDETILALDRGFDRDQIVLLHAYAGSGKTATAREFARWYARTGGVGGPVLFSSFEFYLPLPRLVDRLGEAFRPMLEGSGIHWLALDDAARQKVALQVLQQVPVLWIWDNVESVTGFPAETESAWSQAEQKELVDFLRMARQTKARFLLTSRREERGWLGDLPRRIPVPPMPMFERLQLAQALAARHGRRLTKMEDWYPLLAFTQGNPLTLTILVGQALREGMRSREEVEAFVARLRRGEDAFEDEEREGRSRSLGASLAYGFENAFTSEERLLLSVLHLFQGYVNTSVLCWMGDPQNVWCLPELRGLKQEEGVALLQRAVEVGLLTAYAEGYYGVHPALPWFFKRLFESAWRDRGLNATRAFAEAIVTWGSYCHREYEAGNSDVIAELKLGEMNLLHARRLALSHGWWDSVTNAMQGLRALYKHTGRQKEWNRLVEDIVPYFIDPETEGPLVGQEKQWRVVNDYRVSIAEAELRWTEAERLQLLNVDWSRRHAGPALASPSGELDEDERAALRSLSVSLEVLGFIQREQGREDCIPVLQEALDLAERCGDWAAAASSAYNLGHVFMQLRACYNLDQAEHWYRKSLELRGELDQLGRGRCWGQLGIAAFLRCREIVLAEGPLSEANRYANEAVACYHKALNLIPPDSANDLVVFHTHLAEVYAVSNNIEPALNNYRWAVQYAEGAGNSYAAAQTRYSLALALLGAGRFQEALEYAEAALHTFESYGERAGSNIELVRKWIGKIRQEMNQAPGPASFV
jgi:tetratricopeptide (TPR) repeat protein